MATSIGMSSNALLLIGHNTINAFTDPGAGARAAANLYQTVYEDAITSHSWRFAIGKATLSELVAKPRNEWARAFQLPGDLLMVLRTYPRSNYEIYEDKIYTNGNAVDIDYWFTPSEGVLPPYFVKLMQYRLAAEFAISVTDNRTLAQIFEEKADRQFLVAANRDSQGRPNVAIKSSPFTEVRNASN